jgi:hypothetical protein
MTAEVCPRMIKTGCVQGTGVDLSNVVHACTTP